MVVRTSESPFVVRFSSFHREFNVQIHVLLLRFHAIFSYGLENNDARLGRADDIDLFLIKRMHQCVRSSPPNYSSQEDSFPKLLTC